MHPHPVADGQRRRRHQLAATGRVQAFDRIGQPAHHRIERLRRTLACPRLERARREQEADEHRQRVEVDLRAERPGRIEGRHRAGDEGDRDAQRDRQVHRDAAFAQTVPGAAEEGTGSEDDHRNAQHPAGPVQQAEHVGRDVARRRHIGGRGVHHHLHHAEGGDEEPPQRLARLLGGQHDGLRPGVGKRPVADRAHRLDHRGDPGAPRIPDHHRTLRGTADLGPAHPVDLQQRLLDLAGAGRAVHAADQQARLPQLAALAIVDPLGEGLLLGAIVDRGGLGGGQRRIAAELARHHWRDRSGRGRRRRQWSIDTSGGWGCGGHGGHGTTGRPPRMRYSLGAAPLKT